MSRLPWIAVVIAVGSPMIAAAQPMIAAAQQGQTGNGATQTVYEYQLNYQLPWQRWYGGPGLSIGGTMPTQGAFGYSSLNGLPLPPPLGAGVYVNSSLPPGAVPFGPAQFPFPAWGPRGSPGLTVPPVFADPGPRGGPVLPAMTREPRAGLPSGRRQRAAPSAPAARRASVERQNEGDEKLRSQSWLQAYVHYRAAADLAPERPEAHFRLGLTFTALHQYASAIREFKRSLDEDPTLPQSGETLATIFGAEHGIVTSLILPDVAEWTSRDLRDADRLFLLALLLHFNEDPRGREMMEAALRTTGSSHHVLAFVAPVDSTNNSTNENRHARPRPNRDIPTPHDRGSESTPGDDAPPAPAPPLPGPFPDPPR
jgi:hypothetical protein